MCLNRLFLCLFVLSCLSSFAATSIVAQESSHTGRPLWRSFDSRDTGANEITYSSALNDKGLVYAANEAGLLSYDGVSWRLLPHTPQSRGVTHIIALDLLELELLELNREPWPKGSWLTGGTNGLGIYTPDETGQLNWSSIDVPNSNSSSGTESSLTVQRLMTAGDSVYIISNVGLFTLGPDGVSQAYEGLPTGFAYKHNNGVVFAADDGLVKLTKNSYRALTLPARWSELTPVAVFDNTDLGQLLVTQRSGVFVLETSDSGITLSPLWDELPAPLDTSTVLASAATQAGGLLFGTDDGAILHFSPSGQLLTKLDNRSGLHAGPIRSLSTEPAGNVFAFFDGGAIWFNTNEPLKVWDILNGLENPVTAVAVDSNRVYAGTTAGLYQSVSNGRMRLITDLGDSPIRSLDLFKRSSMRGHTSLIVGSERALIDYSESGATTLYEKPPSAVFISHTQPSRIAVGFGSRVHVFDFDRSEWTAVGPIGPEFKSPVSDFTETKDGDLLVVLKDGTLIAFAADEWLKNQNLEKTKPLWIQEATRGSGFDAAPHFSVTPDTIHLFMTGAALQWDYKNARFQTDTFLTTELSKLSDLELPLWYATKQAAGALWMQTSTGTYALPTAAAEARSGALPSLIALPAPTHGTASYSAIEFDQRTDKMLFATPDGLASYPRPLLTAQHTTFSDSHAKSLLPALHIRSVVVDGQVLYHGDGPQSQITVSSKSDEVLVHFAVLDWQTSCGDDRMVIESDARPNINFAVAPNCTARFAIDDFEKQDSPLTLRLTIDGKAVTQDAHLKLKINRPLISSPLLPLILGVALGLWVLFSQFEVKQTWPEAIQRYSALASGLFILLSTAQAFDIIISPRSVLGAMALWIGVLLTTFVVPVFAEIMLKCGTRLMLWKP